MHVCKCLHGCLSVSVSLFVCLCMCELAHAVVVALAVQVLAHIRGYADAAQEPQHFPTSPALAAPVALARARMQQSDIDYWEINQAFSVVDLVNQQLLGLDPSRCTSKSPVLNAAHWSASWSAHCFAHQTVSEVSCYSAHWL